MYKVAAAAYWSTGGFDSRKLRICSGGMNATVPRNSPVIVRPLVWLVMLIGGAILAWMAYLSWPVTAETPVRERTVVSKPAPKTMPIEIRDVQPCETCAQMPEGCPMWWGPTL